MLPFFGWTTIFVMRSVPGSPTLVQVSPPSTDLYTPLPIETELRVQLSPVPTHITCGLVGSSATAPMDFTGCLSKTGLNVVPPSSDFHTPPEAEPTISVILPSFS